MSEVTLDRFSHEVLEYIAKLIGETRTGSEITEFFKVAGYPRIHHDGGTKWRFVYAALQELNDSPSGPSHIAKIIDKLADPKQYLANPGQHAHVVQQLNSGLYFEGLQLNADYQVVPLAAGAQPPVPASVATAADLELFDRLHFHPMVIEASRSLYESGHYAQAIFEAYKALNNYVKKKSGRTDLDGQKLMAHVFGGDQPMIRLNPLRSQSDADEQKGFNFLYMGAMTGIRNPKAHDSVEQTDALRTLKYLALASLLIERAEEASLAP